MIRDLGAADEAAFRHLWAQYLAFYRVDLDPAITDFTWTRLLDAGSALKARVADVDGVVQGFAVHQAHPSTWVMGNDCYLEDLFVAQAARGIGLGRALIADLQVLAKARGWQRLYWHTDQDNARARALYDSIVPSDGHLRYRIRL